MSERLGRARSTLSEKPRLSRTSCHQVPLGPHPLPHLGYDCEGVTANRVDATELFNQELAVGECETLRSEIDRRANLGNQGKTKRDTTFDELKC